MDENQSTSKIPLSKRLVKEILDDWSEVSKDVVMRNRSWTSFHRWLRVWQKLLNPTELRVTLFMADRFIGYKKSEDKVSFKQIRDGVRKKDGKIIHLGSGAKNKDLIREALKGLKEISFLDFERKSGSLTKYRLITQETLQEKPVPPYLKNQYTPTLKTSSPTTRQILQGRYNKDDDLKNLRDEFVKERGYEPFDEVELSVFKNQKAYREMR